MRHPVTPALAGLAEAVGVAPTHVTFEGGTYRADPEVLVGVLAALGLPVESPKDAVEARAALEADRAGRRLEPVVVHRTGEDRDTLVALGGSFDRARAWLSLLEEDGRWRRARVLDVLAPGTARGVSLRRLAGGPLARGYHQLTLECEGSEDRSLVVSAPRCPQARRGFGVFLPLYALRSASDWGVGSYGDLAELGRFARSAGASLVGTLPLYPAFLDEPADPSPYLPVTRLGYNELYVDPGAVPELAMVPEARRVLDSAPFAAGLREARGAGLVPYELVARLRRQVLQPLADGLYGRAGGGELATFADGHPALLEYARFRANAERHGRDWRRWPAGRLGDAGRLEDPVVRYHLCAQWLAWRQRSEAVRVAPLYGDLPVGVHPDGFDPYFEPDAFATGARVGAPPDRFFPLGQDWSFPPLHPERLRAQGYRHLIEVLRVAFAGVAALRVDHVMGLHRLYWIPEGGDAGHGAYVSYRPDELHALVALEADRAGAVVVGEDLGTVEPQVRATMAEERMLRSFVLEFATTPANPLPEPPEHCIASWGTHDVPRFAAFYRGAAPGRTNRSEDLTGPSEGADGDERARWRAALAAELEATGPELEVRGTAARPESRAERSALAGCLAHLATSRADLVLVDLADLWGEVEQENRPGTGVEAQNWRHRAALSLEEARNDDGVAALLALVERGRAAGRVDEVPER